MSLFTQYVGIDYSGAKTPTSSLGGLRVYLARRDSVAVEVPPPSGPKRYWTRRGVAEWLLGVLRGEEVTLVGIDHAFSFPLEYFQKHKLALDWAGFLDDFGRHWPTDGDHTYVDFVRDGRVGDGASRSGDSRWRRLVETWTRAKSVFQFDVQGQVAKSTHAGIPWLRFLRQQCGDRVFFWPFDGWELPLGRSAVVEVYPSLWHDLYPAENRTGDQHDAFSVAEWMRRADQEGRLALFLNPLLGAEDRERAGFEGWILGVMEDQRSGRARRVVREDSRRGRPRLAYGGTSLGSPFLERPSSQWVASNRLAFAIRDAFPVSPGHTLVVPKRLVSGWFEASLKERQALLDLVDEVRRQLDAGPAPPHGYNIGINVGEAAGQTVSHLHVHVIPRYRGDVEDPRGGVRHVIPGKGNYLAGT